MKHTARTEGNGLGRITAPYFVAGFDYSKSTLKINMTAPIIKYMRGWDVYYARDYCQKKRWQMELLAED